MPLHRSVLTIAIAAAVLAGCTASPAFAPTKLTPQALLVRNRHAVVMRWRADIYHLRYRTVSSDGDVTFTDVYEGGNAPLPTYREVGTLRGLRTERGRFMGRGWRQTPNGLVLGDTSRSSVFDEIVAGALRHPDPRVRVLGITRDAPRAYVLEVVPNARIFQRRYFDTATFQLRKIVTQDYDGNLYESHADDYVWVGGAAVPSHMSQSSSLSHQSSDMRLLSLARLPNDRSVLRPPPSRRPFVPQHALPATLNTLFDSTGILVRADVYGRPYWFKLDSGSASVVLDRAFARELGLSEFGTNTLSKGGKLALSSAVLPRIDVGPVFADNLAVNVLPMAEHEQGVDVVGLLGCDFIGSMPLAIDFAKQTLTILRTAPLRDSRWISVKTPLQGCRPSIRVRLDDVPATLVLDYGSTKMILNEDVAARLGGKLQRLGRATLRYLGDEPLMATQYIVPNVTAGSLQFGPIVADVADGARGQDLDDDGILGRVVLDRFRIVLSYRSQRTFFQRVGNP